ncbi:MAG: 50S ribosomal protein L24 [Verrucomicrobiota bacterium]|nr:50S ribosomal protein L24 [Verrucomicrobiota bacterium]
MGQWIRKGDLVKVIAGNDKGKQGEVLRHEAERVVVQGINVRKKHLRPTQEGPRQRIVEREMPIHISNVVPCDSEGKRLKLRVREVEGEKRLVVQKEGKEETYRVLSKKIAK